MATTSLNSISTPDVRTLTSGRGSKDRDTLYLDRCQVDTPTDVVKMVWHEVLKRRVEIGEVVDFGAGDGRFAHGGIYGSYTGYEIDPSRPRSSGMPSNATVVHACAFAESVTGADLCIGNPPYVRNQDLPSGWRERAARKVHEQTGVRISGLANAWQYFFLLGIASTGKNGLLALVIPYEWVSRPSATAIREYIEKKGWRVSVYRLLDDTFPRVLTTSSITVIDKSVSDKRWDYYQQTTSGKFQKLRSMTATSRALLPYQRARTLSGRQKPHAKRGLSPGTQKVLTLTEAERARLGFRIGTDVVPCVTSMRHLPIGIAVLSKAVFRANYVNAGKKCWLINTKVKPSKHLAAYLEKVPVAARATSTCEARDVWWKFAMPQVPAILVSTGFTGDGTKVAVNTFNVRAVGGVCGVYAIAKSRCAVLARALRDYKIADEIVSHANGLMKLEINQLNTLISKLSCSTRKVKT